MKLYFNGHFSLKYKGVFNVFKKISTVEYHDVVKKLLNLMETEFGVPFKCESKNGDKFELENVDNLPWDMYYEINCRLTPVDENVLSCCYFWVTAKGSDRKSIRLLGACSDGDCDEKIIRVAEKLQHYFCEKYSLTIGDGFEGLGAGPYFADDVL